MGAGAPLGAGATSGEGADGEDGADVACGVAAPVGDEDGDVTDDTGAGLVAGSTVQVD